MSEKLMEDEKTIAKPQESIEKDSYLNDEWLSIKNGNYQRSFFESENARESLIVPVSIASKKKKNKKKKKQNSTVTNKQEIIYEDKANLTENNDKTEENGNNEEKDQSANNDDPLKSYMV